MLLDVKDYITVKMLYITLALNSRIMLLESVNKLLIAIGNKDCGFVN